MKDLIDILCWFFSLAIGFIALFFPDSTLIDELTSILQGLVSED